MRAEHQAAELAQSACGAATEPPRILATNNLPEGPS